MRRPRTVTQPSNKPESPPAANIRRAHVLGEAVTRAIGVPRSLATLAADTAGTIAWTSGAAETAHTKPCRNASCIFLPSTCKPCCSACA